ncbi:hypothetical protein P4361_07810 [Fictibacillus sp. B-59209]|uniref:hypothetical protein n=1 Tax=Fictibacillus sp. B-59209 TaxID=3024873 RepID=UPI002E1C2652|nr:hypothetical protein [Fictibacillus sp. B-59209]
MHPDWKKKIVITGMAAILNVTGTAAASEGSDGSGHENSADGKLDTDCAEREQEEVQ